MSCPAPHSHTAEVPPGDQFSVREKFVSSNSEAPLTVDASSDTGTRVAVAQEDAPQTVPGELIRVDRTYYHSGTDQHDYETKFTEDQKFEEMAPMARVFKMSLEEYARLDADKVEDWRDGLDVLLVFAGVFSAVVSTLVGQTSSKLQVDFGEVSAHLMTEMVLLQRAAMNNLPDSSVPVSDVTLTSTLRVSSTDTWVNGLWFTSLALSLAAALIAVLTKQWIHQFRTSTSGTAQDRLRIRQFRYEQLTAWHVPLIIGMLPIFMHISLGAFLAGLVIYVRSLSTPIAVTVGVIAFTAFVVYFGTNMHPVFYPASPYKTFLTRYTYRFYHGICECLTNVQIPPMSPSVSTSQPMSVVVASADTIAVPFNSDSDDASPTAYSGELSLERVEMLMVDSVAPQLDARALSDLYNLSSNTCVKSIILQSFSNLPLQTISIVTERIPILDKVLVDHIKSVEFTLPEKQASFERLFRAHVRIRTTDNELAQPASLKPNLILVARDPDALSVLLDTRRPARHAADYLCEHVMRTEEVAYHDILSWARILQRALDDGPDWLEVDNYESPIWKNLFCWLVQSHGCLADTECHSSFIELVALPLAAPPEKPELDDLQLKVREYPKYPTTMKVMFTEVVSFLLRTSIAKYILNVAYPDACIHKDFHGLPVDILLNLAILQSPKICTTSRAPKVYGAGHKQRSAIGHLLHHLREYLAITGEISDSCGTLKRHSNVVQASFRSIAVVMYSPGFIDGSLTSEDARIMVSAFARTLRLDSNIYLRACAEIPRRVLDAVMVAAFGEFPLDSDTATIITDILCAHAVADQRKLEQGALDIGVEMYCFLLDNQWLSLIDDVVHDFVQIEACNVGEDGKMLEHYYLYMLLAVAYVDGLKALSVVSPPCYDRTCEYLQTNALSLCKLLTLADSARADRLLMLPTFVPSTVVSPTIKLLRDFTASPDFKKLYDAYRTSFHGRKFDGYADYPPLDTFLPALNAKLDMSCEMCILSVDQLPQPLASASQLLSLSSRSGEESGAPPTGTSFLHSSHNIVRQTIRRMILGKSIKENTDTMSLGTV